jgi:elongation factor Ts
VVSATDVPAEVLAKEKAIEMEKEDIKSKPEAIRCVFCRLGRGN